MRAVKTNKTENKGNIQYINGMVYFIYILNLNVMVIFHIYINNIYK